MKVKEQEVRPERRWSQSSKLARRWRTSSIEPGGVAQTTAIDTHLVPASPAPLHCSHNSNPIQQEPQQTHSNTAFPQTPLQHQTSSQTPPPLPPFLPITARAHPRSLRCFSLRFFLLRRGRVEDGEREGEGRGGEGREGEGRGGGGRRQEGGRTYLFARRALGRKWEKGGVRPG